MESVREYRLKYYRNIFDSHGGTDFSYFSHHLGRFEYTRDEFLSTWNLRSTDKVLDVGAHWLHQSLLWRLAGFNVTAIDLPLTFDLLNVKSLAESQKIELIPCGNLERAEELNSIPDDSYDIVLFTEILEHLTFNPVKFWQEIYRIIRPAGRIVITTPNYYAWNGRAWSLGRFFGGFGGGITVDEILTTHTYGHHWREYSRHEIIRYFCLLSKDFDTVKAKTVRNYYPLPTGSSRRVNFLRESIPILRPNIHIEIQVKSKLHGIMIQPAW